jgi:HTH-type transcriptional regulator / antitoxin HigA
MGVSIVNINPAKYGRLCAEVVPKVIESDDEFDRLSEKLEYLTFQKERTVEEEALAELLLKLIQDYDDSRHELPDLPPHKLIQYLMEQRNLHQIDLLPVFGSRSVASDVINGHREPSKAHIRKLADFFGMPPELFL